MSPSKLVKIFGPGDIPALYALVRDGRHSTEEAYFERAFEEQTADKRLVFIISLDEKLVGYAHYNRFPKYTPFRRLGIPEIQDLYVHPDYRCQGFGAALIAACEAQAKSESCTDIGIGVGITVEFGNAQRLYMAQGYRPDGVGVVFEREPVQVGEIRPIDDRLCLMLLKTL